MLGNFFRRLILPEALRNPSPELIARGYRSWGVGHAVVQFVRNLFLRKLTVFWSPPQSEIVVYSQESLPHLKALLQGMSYQVMDTSFKRTFSGRLCVKALLRAVFNTTTLDVRIFARYTAHFVQLTQCNLIISAVDAQSALAHVTLLNPSARRLAFQITNFKGQFIPAGGCAAPPADVYLVWSDEHRRAINRLVQAACPQLSSKPEIISTGSLKSNQVPLGREDLDDGLLFISTWRSHANTNRFEQTRRVFPLLSRWCAERGMNFSVLGSLIDEPIAEQEFFESLAGNFSFKYLCRERDWKSSFRTLDRFGVVVTDKSSLGFESLARGKKTLFFDSTANSPTPRFFPQLMLDNPIGFCWVTDGNLGNFWNLLDNVAQMSEREFFALSLAEKAIVPPRDAGLAKTRAIVRAEIARGAHPVGT